MDWRIAVAILAIGVIAGAGLVYLFLRIKGMDRWIISYVKTRRFRRLPGPDDPVHLIFAICDHYEPKRGGVTHEQAKARVQQWIDEYPKRFSQFRDANGRPPQYTFFYPADEYDPELVDMVAVLCRKGYGEIEIHLHHDNDTEANLRKTLIDFKTALHERHGALSRDPRTGEIVYGFIHGNWTLDNSGPTGKDCGVNNELDVLRETGCYADFTLPSAPNPAQTRKINSIYWAVDDPLRPKSHDLGIDVGSAPQPANSLLMIQGPLVLDWKSRKFGLLPKIENSCLQKSQPPDTTRLDNWLRASVKVATHPNWYFVKLYTHGVWEPNQDVLLGSAMDEFYRELGNRSERNPKFRVHYVTARQMANLALAPESVLEPTIEAMNAPYPEPTG
jgi:hypothetical protein